MVRSAQRPLTPPTATFRADLDAIVRAGIAGASAGRAVARAIANEQLCQHLDRPLYVVAAGKAAASMAAAFLAEPDFDVRRAIAVGTHRPAHLPLVLEWRDSAHPFPDQRSVAAGALARELAAQVDVRDTLLLLLSGGASALLCLPAPGITLDDKRRTIERMMLAGADIHALNTVRKHLSAIKGGQLASGCNGHTLTLAVSDVVGDELSIIGSGPGVADPSTWTDVERALVRFGGDDHPAAVSARVAAGLRGEVPDTPKAGSPNLARASAHVIASRADAMAAAAKEAAARGYRTRLLETAVTGEARVAAAQWMGAVRRLLADSLGPTCVVSAGETTVRVRGAGKGGRNQEFGLALVRMLADFEREVVLASAGTDGIDGPTDAAGALVDRGTLRRASALGLSPEASLERNDAYRFFDPLGDLIRTGPTDTNVGDVQVLLATEWDQHFD